MTEETTIPAAKKKTPRKIVRPQASDPPPVEQPPVVTPNSTQSVIFTSIVNWAKGFISTLLPLIDARSLLLIGGSGLGAWFALPATMQPLMLTAAQLVLAFVFAVGVAHLIRKILLSGNFDLSVYAEKAKENSLASAIVFVAVLAFVAVLIMAIVAAILPK